MSFYFALLTVENNKNKKSVKFQGDMLNYCDFIQVFVFTTNHHLKIFTFHCQYNAVPPRLSKQHKSIPFHKTLFRKLNFTDIIMYLHLGGVLFLYLNYTILNVT